MKALEGNNEQIIITLLETSDIHGNILPINYGNNTVNELGLAKVASIIKAERRRSEHVIVIDNGDLIQGTPLTYYHARMDYEPSNPMINVCNYLNYDLAVFENHEFNYGQDILQKAIRESTFPWLSANIVKIGTDEPYYGKPYVVKNYKGGLKIGFLGLTTHYIPNWENPNHIKEVEFIDAVTSAKRWVKVLKDEEKVDVLVVCYHGGFERDPDTGEPTEQLTGENQGYQLCQEVEGIDVLLTGHQHRSIAGKRINGVTIVQPGHQGREVGKVNLTLERHKEGWHIVQIESELLSVEGVSPDENVIQMTQDYEQKTQQWLDQPIGEIKGDMLVKDPIDIRTKDNALIEFFNKVQLEYGKVDISNTALFDNQSPGLNPNVTMRDIVSNYIYPNTLRVLRIKGQDIKDALERTASYFDTYNGQEIKVNPQFYMPKPQHYNYDMWEGIEYRLNISRPFGERVVVLTYKGKPLQMDHDYDVVMNNYRAGGGGDYLMFKDKPVILDIPTDVSELIANYILERRTIEATVNHNWEVVHD